MEPISLSVNKVQDTSIYTVIREPAVNAIQIMDKPLLLKEKKNRWKLSKPTASNVVWKWKKHCLTSEDVIGYTGELPAVLYERQKSRNTEQANSTPEIS